MELNAIQKAAYDLIQADARFLYTLTTIKSNAKNVNSNYIMMSQPYIGLFAYGAEQWCGKIGMPAPTFTEEEKLYYALLRQRHKLYELPYLDYMTALTNKLKESDAYFLSIRSPFEKYTRYYNVGTDLFEGTFCGNTILCALYSPVEILTNKDIGTWIRNISVVAGKLAAFFKCTDFEPYRLDLKVHITYRDYHFYENCPISIKTDLGFVLFSVLCSVNYTIKFIEGLFKDEIPQKFKFAYLQYYYLCDFISELNEENRTKFVINDVLKNRDLRNCLAHYGLGQYLSEKDLLTDDPLKGLTIKAFDMDYMTAKKQIYLYLTELVDQIKIHIGLDSY